MRTSLLDNPWMEPSRGSLRRMGVKTSVMRAANARRAWVGLSTVAVLGLAGCTSASPSSLAQTTPAPTTGTLSGMVLLFGGPATLTATPDSGRPLPGQTVSVQVNHRSVIAKQSDSAGRFTFVLAPGSYMLACPDGPKAFQVAAGLVVSLDCPVYAF